MIDFESEANIISFAGLPVQSTILDIDGDHKNEILFMAPNQTRTIAFFDFEK